MVPTRGCYCVVRPIVLQRPRKMPSACTLTLGTLCVLCVMYSGTHINEACVYVVDVGYSIQFEKQVPIARSCWWFLPVLPHVLRRRAWRQRPLTLCNQLPMVTSSSRKLLRSTSHWIFPHSLISLRAIDNWYVWCLHPCTVGSGCNANSPYWISLSGIGPENTF
jgi:hypothetical protein